MSVKTKLIHSLLQVLKKDTKGSYATLQDRRSILTQVANDILFLGFKITDIYALKLKHIEAAIKYLARKTIK